MKHHQEEKPSIVAVVASTEPAANNMSQVSKLLSTDTILAVFWEITCVTLLGVVSVKQEHSLTSVRLRGAAPEPEEGRRQPGRRGNRRHAGHHQEVACPLFPADQGPEAAQDNLLPGRCVRGSVRGHPQPGDDRHPEGLQGATRRVGFRIPARDLISDDLREGNIWLFSELNFIRRLSLINFIRNLSFMHFSGGTCLGWSKGRRVEGRLCGFNIVHQYQMYQCINTKCWQREGNIPQYFLRRHV